MSKIRECMETIKNGGCYDWICRHGYNLTHDELMDIIKEYDFAIHTMQFGDTKEDLYQSIYEEMLDRFVEEE